VDLETFNKGFCGRGGFRAHQTLLSRLRRCEVLEHENILKLVGFYLSPGLDKALFVSTWAVEGNMSDYLARKNPGLEKRLQLAIDTARGLSYLHTRDPSVCHGDIKTLNGLISPNLRAMLCDVGLGRILEEHPSGLTTTKAMTGTTRYAAPEIVMENARRSLQSDIWAWGCLLFEILTDDMPYVEAKPDMAVLLAIAQGATPGNLQNHKLPEFTVPILQACWTRPPLERPTVNWCLEALLRGQGAGQLMAGAQ